MQNACSGHVCAIFHSLKAIYSFSSPPCFFRYGVEPPVLVKLEKEIELEETLLMTSNPVTQVITPKSCCQRGALHEAVRIIHVFQCVHLW